MKKTTFSIRFFLLLLAFSLMLSTFAACAISDEESATTEQGSNDVEAEESVMTDKYGNVLDPDLYDEKGFLKDGLGDDLNFSRELLVLSGKEQQWSLGTTDEMKGHVIGEAIYARNAMVEERLGITIKWDPQPNFNGNDQTAFMQRIETDIKGAGTYDCVVSYNLLPYPLAMKGLLSNLANNSYIDLEKPWWPAAYLDQILYKDQIYALVSASEKSSLENLSAIYFNNELIENYKLESPYDLVKDNDWNVGTLKEMIKGTYSDLNGNGTVDKNDQFGLSTSTNARISSWYFGMGLKLITRDANGDLVLTAGEAKVGETIDTILDLFSTNDSSLVDALNSEGALNNTFPMFTLGRAVFYLATLYMGEYCASNNIVLNYGVAPMPKLNAEQDRYYTHMPNNHPVWYIPNAVDDFDCSSAFIEGMASEAYRRVEPVYYENCVKLRYAPDERLGEMYDLIRESITFDMNYVFRFYYRKDVDSQIRNCIANPTKYQWSSTWGSIKDLVEQDFQAIVDTYTELAK